MTTMFSEASRSLVAYGFWIMTFSAWIWTTPFYNYNIIVLLISTGIYLASTWPTMYSLICATLVIVNITIWTCQAIAIATQATNNILEVDYDNLYHQLNNLKQIAFKFGNLIWLSICESIKVDTSFWNGDEEDTIAQTMMKINHSLTIVRDSISMYDIMAINKIKITQCSFLFLIWYPSITFSLDMTFRITGLITFVTTIHVFFIIINVIYDALTTMSDDDANDATDDIVKLWVEVYNRKTTMWKRAIRDDGDQEQVKTYKVALGLVALATLTFLFGSLPLWLLVTILSLGMGLLATLIMQDRVIQKKFRLCQERFIGLIYPIICKLMLLSILPLWTDLQESLKTFKKGLQAVDKERMNLHFCLGVLIVVTCCLVSYFHEIAALALYTLLVFGWPACACTEASSGDSGGRSPFFPMPFGILLGFVAALSAEGLLGGYILTYSLGHPKQWIEFLVRVPVGVVWFWFNVGMVYAQFMMYLNLDHPQLRHFIFQSWRKKVVKEEEIPPTLELDVSCSFNKSFLRQTLSGIKDTAKSTYVHFKHERGVDAGGLKRQWASIISRSLVVPPATELVPMLKCWEDESNVYDVNYDYMYSGTTGDTEGAADDDSTADDSMDVNESYYKLGVVIGIFLLNGLQLKVRLSRALCKVLLQHPQPSTADGDEDQLPQRQPDIVWNDLVELCPKKAEHLFNPTTREYLDYEEVVLPSIFGPELLAPIATGMTNDDFHPPATPSPVQFDGLAKKIIMNQHVDDMRNHIRRGFRKVVDLMELGRLFTVGELQELLHGSSSIDIDDMKRNCVVYVTGANRRAVTTASIRHPTIQLLWKSLQKLSQEQLQSFLEFVTGQPTPPSGGFSELSPLFNVLLTESSVGGVVAHTCTNQIEMPSNVRDLSTMKRILISAIETTDSPLPKRQLFNAG